MILNVLDWRYNENYGRALAREYLGRLPLMLDPSRPEPPDVQLDSFWTMMPRASGWMLTADDYLMGPAYEPKAPAAMAEYPGGAILAFPHRFVAIVLDNGQFMLGRLNDG